MRGLGSRMEIRSDAGTLRRARGLGRQRDGASLRALRAAGEGAASATGFPAPVLGGTQHIAQEGRPSGSAFSALASRTGMATSPLRGSRSAAMDACKDNGRRCRWLPPFTEFSRRCVRPGSIARPGPGAAGPVCTAFEPCPRRDAPGSNLPMQCQAASWVEKRSSLACRETRPAPGCRAGNAAGSARPESAAAPGTGRRAGRRSRRRGPATGMSSSGRRRTAGPAPSSTAPARGRSCAESSVAACASAAPSPAPQHVVDVVGGAARRSWRGADRPQGAEIVERVRRPRGFRRSGSGRRPSA